MELFEELEERGLVHQVTEHEVPLATYIAQPRCLYAGFDPTAQSLHVGTMIPLIALRRFQLAGHRVIALAGGATGMVGDPSGKSEERNLLDRDALRANLAGNKAQLERFLDFSGPSPAMLVDNLDWSAGVPLLDFLRDIGKHFTINSMMRKDSVRTRLEREGEGISYTEFSYMLLQAHDFYWLFREHGCTLQIGGSDQWGNITAGVDLIRKKLGETAYGLTMPLLMNADGQKFGKTGQGTVWLDPGLTSPMAFRQFWFNTTDADVIERLKYFTFLPLEEIEELQRLVQDKSDPNAAQRRLARAMTALVHGEAEAQRVEKAVVALRQGNLRELPLEYLEDAFVGAPTVVLARERLGGEGIPWLDLVVHALRDGEQKPLSKGAARRLIQQNAVALNGEVLNDLEAGVTGEWLIHDRYLILRKGKKHQFLVRVAG